jgi:hypothetical protein
MNSQAAIKIQAFDIPISKAGMSGMTVPVLHKYCDMSLASI